MRSFISRASCADHATTHGLACFRTKKNPDGTWSYRPEIPSANFKIAKKFAATRDYIHHVEQHDNDAPVFIVTCLREEIIEKLPFKCAPITPSLWESARSNVPAPRGVTSSSAPRARSSNADPVKTVWDMATANPGITRKEIIQRCVALGVSPNTASTQFYLWRQKHGV